MTFACDRRSFINTGVSLAFGLAACRRATDDHLYLNYDEPGLDAAYDQRNWADNIADVYARLDARTADVLARFGEPARHAYGPAEIEGLDWYPTSAPGAPVHVHLYGGGWRGGASRRNAFMAPTFVESGVHFVVPDYVKVQDTDGRLGPLADDACRALAWVYANAARLGADPEQIYISGHSSGGHLAGVAAVADWSQYDMPRTIIKAALCVSGMFDLVPVSLSARNEYVTFTEADVASLSPLNHLDRLTARVAVAYGTNESPEFQRQSIAFADAIRTTGRPVDTVVGTNLNHFEILETFASPDGLMGRAALAQIV